jgi:hypothetical protein
MMILLALALAAGDPAATAASPNRADDPMVCKTEARSGTRVARRVCSRRSAIEARAEKDRRMADEVINQPQINPSSNGS